MKHFLIRTLCWGSILFMSCGKESSREPDKPAAEDTTQNNNSNVKLLTRIAEYNKEEPNDSTIIDFYYNANNKLIRTKELSSPGIRFEDDEVLIYRDDNDVVQRVTIMTSHFENSIFTHKDSAVFDLVYDPASKHYKYGICTNSYKYDDNSDFIRDSLAYTYNDKDQITVLQVFRKDMASGTYFEAERREHDFDVKGNIVKIRTNENYDNQGDPLTEEIITYDDKINPLNFGMEGFLLGIYSFSWPTPNNYVKLSENQPAAYLYTYNDKDYPVLMEYSFGDEGGKRYYYYQ